MSADGLIPERWYDRDALDVAHDLLGMLLVRDEVTLRITEVEAYRGPLDSASHSRMGRTRRNAPMWGAPGRVYVYLCYGIHHMLNVVTGTEGHGAAVLVRAGEPVTGLETIRQRRGGKQGPVLLTGPGKVGAALGLDTSWNTHPLFEPGGVEIWTGIPPKERLVGPRVGIDYATEQDRCAPWRLAAGDTLWVSHRKTLAPVPRSR